MRQRNAITGEKSKTDDKNETKQKQSQEDFFFKETKTESPWTHILLRRVELTLSLVGFGGRRLALLRVLLLPLHLVHLLRALLAVVLLRLGQQLLVLVLRHVHGGAQVLLQLPVMLHVVPLVLEELDDGVFGEIQLGREGVDGFLVGVEAHVVDEALQDAQGF